MALMEIGLRTDVYKLVRELVRLGVATQKDETLTIHLSTAAENLRQRNRCYTE